MNTAPGAGDARDDAIAPQQVRGGRPLRQRILRARWYYLLCLPSLALVAVFGYYPAVLAFWKSFYLWNGTTVDQFVGWQNFQNMSNDPALQASIGNAIRLVVFSVVVTLTMPMAVAVAIFRLPHVRVQYWLRVLFVMPIVIPGVVLLLLWQYILQPGEAGGLLDRFLQYVGLGAWQHYWLADQTWTIWATFMPGFPWSGGVVMLVYLAGLMAIPDSLIDAARIDGCGGWIRFWRIELPLILGQVKLWVILTVIGAVQGFQNQLIIPGPPGGGPGFASEVPGLVMYQAAAQSFQFGYGSAIGLVLFLIIVVLTVLNVRFLRSNIDFAGA